MKARSGFANRTPLAKGETRTPMLDLQLTVHRPIGVVDCWGVHVFFEEAQTIAEREAAIDRAMAGLRDALREEMR